MKRVWQHAQSIALDGGHCILLDGKPLKIPGGGLLTVPFALLADAIAAEWQNAGPDGRDFGPDDLKLTRLATTAIARIATARAAIIPQIAAYGANDLLCYHAETPAELAARQAEQWSPWLAWTAKTFGLRLNTGTGITPISQPPRTQATFISILCQKSDFDLAGLGVAVPALGSLVLGLAMLQNALTAQAAYHLATLDEQFQTERWGQDTDAKTRNTAILDDLTLTQTFWKLCR
jgi:chaperone required for assembly of F1-ATPase